MREKQFYSIIMMKFIVDGDALMVVVVVVVGVVVEMVVTHLHLQNLVTRSRTRSAGCLTCHR